MPFTDKEKRRLYLRKYRAEHPEYREKGSAQTKAWRAANREQRLAYERQYRQDHLQERRAYDAAYQRKRRAEDPTWHRERHLRRAYGIMLEQYDQMLEKQHGVCAICKKLPDTEHHGVFHVDHDHETNVVRGLLCSNCNTGIGLLNGNFAAAEEYMKNPPAV